MTQTPRLASLFLLTAVSLAAACGGDDDDDNDDSTGDIDAAVDEADAAIEIDGSVIPDSGPEVDGGTRNYTAHIVEQSCAPNDALAISIKLSSSVDAKTCTPNFFDPTLVVDLYVAPDDIEAPVTFEIEEFAEGAVQVCPGGKNGCADGFTATVQLDTFETGQGATGTVTILDDDTIIAEVELDADWCEPEGGPVTCG